MGKTVKEIFESLAQMYENSVAEQDKLGYGELYAACAADFFNHMESDGFHPIDIEYLDGYFLFGFGTNTVVHFHIQECPGWKFGIWWQRPKLADSRAIEGEWFGQYEETIDKFKPSRSMFCETFTIDVDRDTEEMPYSIRRNIEFIRDEPYLAFCRDYCWWDYNLEYHTREEAQQVFVSWQNKTQLEAKATEHLLNMVIDAVTKVLGANLSEGEELWLVDRGEYWSPRCQFVVYAPTMEHGMYWLEDIEGWTEVKAEINKFCEECDAKHLFISFSFISHEFFTVTDEPIEPNEFTKLLASRHVAKS